MPGFTLAVFGDAFENRPPRQIITAVVLGIALFLGIHAWNMYSARKRQREIDALNGL